MLHLRQPSSKLASRPLILLSVSLTFLCLAAFFSRRSPSCAADPSAPQCPHPLACSDTTDPEPTPRPLVIISAGAPRASSTVLYNALRILLRIRDPNTVSGWYADLNQLYMSYAKPIPRNGTLADVAEGNRLNAFRALGTVLIKLHTVRDWYDFLGGGDQEPVMEGVVDALFITHRDIRDAVRSIRDMGWGVPFTDSQRAHKDFCRRRITSGNRVRYLTPDEYKKPETWVSLARSQIRCREVLLETAGAAVKMDVRAEDLSNMDFTETIALLKELGRNLDYEYSDAELDLAAKELRKIRPSRCDSGYEIEMTVNPVTHLHKGHVRPMKSLDAHVGMDAITQDEICAAWLKRYLYDV